VTAEAPTPTDRRAGASALAATVVRVLTLPRRMLVRRQALGTGPAPATTDEASASAAEHPEPTDADAGSPPPDPNRPTLTSLLSTRGRRPGWLAILVAAVIAGGLAGAVTAPLAAPVVFAAVVLGCLVPWSRALFVLAPVGLLVATGVYVAVRQHEQQIATNIEWPAQFPLANTLSWMAIAALLAAAAVEVARWRPWVVDALAQEQASRSAAPPAPALDEGPADGPSSDPGEAKANADNAGQTMTTADPSLRASEPEVEQAGSIEAQGDPPVTPSEPAPTPASVDADEPVSVGVHGNETTAPGLEDRVPGDEEPSAATAVAVDAATADPGAVREIAPDPDGPSDVDTTGDPEDAAAGDGARDLQDPVEPPA
jgi:hypothetical protein